MENTIDTRRAESYRLSEGNRINLMAEKKRLRKGEAKIQIIACRERIDKLRAEGYGPVAIHEILTNDGVITMSYGGFYEAFVYGEVRKKRRKKRISKPGWLNPDQAIQSANSAAILPVISPPQNVEWSLDEKLEALNTDSKRSEKNATTEEIFQESEVL